MADIDLASLQCSHKAPRTARGAANSTGPTLPDFTLLCIKIYLFIFLDVYVQNKKVLTKRAPARIYV